MLDTYILALKKKPLTFLQMYHHTVIVLMCWSWIQSGWSMHWFVIWGLLLFSFNQFIFNRIGIVANTVVIIFAFKFSSLHFRWSRHYTGARFYVLLLRSVGTRGQRLVEKGWVDAYHKILIIILQQVIITFIICKAISVILFWLQV